MAAWLGRRSRVLKRNHCSHFQGDEMSLLLCFPFSFFFFSRCKTDDTTWPPPFSTAYDKPQGRTQRIVWQGAPARLVCVLGSWDNFAQVVPLGFDNETRVHSLCLVLSPDETHTFSFIIDGKTGCLDQANCWPIVDGAHVLRPS